MTGVHVRLDGDRYAIDVTSIVEVERRAPLTPVWGAPPLVLGVRNLRGMVLPVLDLPAALGLPALADPGYVVVVEARGAHAGLGVDEVIDVLPVPFALEPAGQPGLRGRAVVDGELVGVVDVPAILEMVSGP